MNLTILICRSKQHFKDAYRYPKLYDEASSMIERIAMQGDAMNVEVCTENEYVDEDIKLFSQALSDDDEMLSECLSRLGGILREMGY